MLKEVSASVKSVLYDRVSNPIYGTFLVSWFICNWQQAVPLLFGDGKFDSRFALFRREYLPGGWSEPVNYLLFALPFALTFLFLYLVPKLQAMAFIHNEKKRAAALDTRDQLNQHRLVSREELDRVIDENDSIRIKYVEERAGLQSQIAQSRQESTRLLTSLREQEEELNTLRNALDDNRLTLKQAEQDKHTAQDKASQLQDSLQRHEANMQRQLEDTRKHVEELESSRKRFETLNAVNVKQSQEIDRLRQALSATESTLRKVQQDKLRQHTEIHDIAEPANELQGTEAANLES